MRKSTLFVTVLLLLLNACAINRAPSANLLEKRSDYEKVHEIKGALEEVDRPLLVPTRTTPTIADIWVHPHELANGDYFRGGWIRTVVTRAYWQVEEKKQSLLMPEPVENKNRKSLSRGDHHE